MIEKPVRPPPPHGRATAALVCGGRRSRIAALLAGALALAALGCASLPGIDEVNAFTVEDEWRLGSELAAEYDKKLDLVRDARALQLLNELGAQLVAQGRFADRPWTFHIVRDEEWNAFNIPVGHVYVNTGLVLAAGDGAELMGVLAHETAHGMERHATLQLTRAYGLQVVLGMALGRNASVLEDIAANLAASGTLAHYSRGAEREADQEGLRLASAAGWDPRGLSRFFDKLTAQQRTDPGRVARFFASHPPSQTRSDDVEAAVASLPRTGSWRTDSPAFQELRARLAR